MDISRNDYTSMDLGKPKNKGLSFDLDDVFLKDNAMDIKLHRGNNNRTSIIMASTKYKRVASVRDSGNSIGS